jgi:ABC-type phosphate transport system substrate-binding protein
MYPGKGAVIALTVVFFALAMGFLPPPIYAGQDPLRGVPFSDPDLVQEMEKEWIEKTITYNDENSEADLVVTLNQQFFEFIVPYIEKYGRDNKINIKMQRGTCGISAGMLSKKQGDIGAFCCPPAKTDRLPGLKFHTIGIHPISILVHPDNPTNDLPFSTIRKIFQGEISRWSELQWEDSLIQVVTRLHCKKRPGHWRLLLDKEDFFSPESRSVGAIEDMFSLVAQNRSAIGYEVMWQAHRNAGKVKSLNIDNMNPRDLDHLLQGRYPIYRVLYITTWEDQHLQKPHSRELVAFIIDQIEQNGAPQGIIPVSKLKEAGWKFRGSELVGEPMVK